AIFPFPAAMRTVQDDFLFIFLITFFQCGMIFTTLEIWEMIKRNRNLNITLAKVEKEKVESQLQVLRQQINPHFLFNSLNVLSELIHEDIEKSDLFIQHFAKVYRYVLQINQETIVTLQEELAFLDSYVFLQKIRFGDNLQVEIGVSQAALQKYVPPLSLQVLFENAIKHNAISASMPLCIKITTEQDVLKLTNTLQRLTPSKNETGIGQLNLKNKYELISEKLPDFYIDNGDYVSELPLISIES
ncbi:MAG: histidine kinase, partial [Bacteroidota bacterium]